MRPAGSSPLLIWGAGAMGGSIGAAWVDAGEDVLFVDTDRDHVEAMNEGGLRITGPVVETHVRVSATHPEDLRGTFPLIFLCVKAHHTGAASTQLAPHLASEGVVVSVQNGLCELEIAEIVGWGRTIGAFVNFGADYLEPGLIHRGNRGAVVVGELDGGETRRVVEIHRLLQVFEPDAILSDNIFGYLWAKLAYAALLFATALTDEAIADVLASEAHRPLLRALAREVVAVAEIRGIDLKGFDGFGPHAFGAGGSDEGADASLRDLVAFNRASAKSHSGIWRDLAVRKRPTEVDAQLGAVVRLGKEIGAPAPLTEALVRQVHEIEAGERGRCWENLEELWAGSIGGKRE
ncbi:MAG: ketopantoate reductase family protein [Longimicrobiales bacterium]